MRKILSLIAVAVVACGTTPPADAVFESGVTKDGGASTGSLGPSGSKETSCTLGATQVCPGGTQTCIASNEFTTWSACVVEDAEAPSPPEDPAPLPPGENPGELKMNINVDGDCVCAPACPPQAPFVIGCNITFEGSNSNGCVATAKDGKTYFQEGVKCDEGHLSGFIACGSKPGPGLNAENCPINKSDPHYASKPSDCPDITNNSKPDKCYF